MRPHARRRKQRLPLQRFPLRLLLQGLPGVRRFLDRADVLDPAGGTDIFHMPPGAREAHRGHGRLRCLRLSSKVLRWYTRLLPDADCQHPRLAGLPGRRHRSLLHGPRGRRSFPGRGLGPPLCRIYERSAVGPLPPNAPAPPSVGVFARRASKLLGWWVRGLGRPTPFFDDRTKAPRAVPRVLTQSERAAL